MAVLPSGGVAAQCRAYVQELLIHPPPRDTAAAIRQACVLLCALVRSNGAG